MAADNRTTFVQLAFAFSEPELWCPVVEWEGFYEVSSLGRVRSCERRVMRSASARRGPSLVTIQSKIRRPTHGGKQSPYPRVYLWREHIGVSKMVHHMVLEAFVGPKPPDAVANHIDGNKQNNRVSNLQWCSRSYNNVHAMDIGLVQMRGEAHFAHKYSTEQVRAIRHMAKDGMSLVAIAKHCEMPLGTVFNIVRRKTWKHLPEE
jgi:hypothetical protein